MAKNEFNIDGMTRKQEGSYTPFLTSDIIGWCYLDEPVNEP